MDRVKICDICLIDGIIEVSKWKVKFRTGGLKVDLCEKHKLAVKDKSEKEVLDLCVKAEYAYNQIIRG